MLEDLRNQKEIETFLIDFFDNKELEKYTKRLAVAYWLKKGRDKANIMQNLHASLGDVKRTKKLLNKEGIKLALKKIEAEEWANQWSEKIKKFTKSNR
jgi:uncharacterized protein YerC